MQTINKKNGSIVSCPNSVMLSALTFQTQYERFRAAVRANSEGEFSSFRDGLPLKWEGYKEHLRTKARAILKFLHWKEKDIGTGRILERVIRAIEINEGSSLRNNLVGWEPRYGPQNIPHRVLREARADKTKRFNLERAMYDLFRSDKSEAGTFKTLQDLGVTRYEVLAYLFFLKDWDRFMPIRTKTFDKAFHNLGLQVQTAWQCSWENYHVYNEALQQVLCALRDIATLDDVRLIDAHSFCWMLARLKVPVGISDVKIPLPKSLNPAQAALWEKDEGSSMSDVDEAGQVDDEYYDQRAKENRRRGALAEEYALRSEQERLKAANRPDLAENIRSVSDKPSLGYDINSWETTGEPRYIEVKAARRSGKQCSFFLSENEWRHSRRLQNYYFYLVFDIDEEQPDIRYLKAEQVTSDSRRPINYFVRLPVDASA